MRLASRPDPAPLETDDVRIVAGGTALWAAAFVVLVVLDVAGANVHGWWIAMCGYGTLLGLVGVKYCQRRRTAGSRAAAGAVEPLD